MNLRPSGYEPDELPDCSTPRHWKSKREGRGLAATCSSAAVAAVPSARRVFTAEFGMGSGVFALAMATRPPPDNRPQAGPWLEQGAGVAGGVCHAAEEVSGGAARGLAAARGRPPGGPAVAGGSGVWHQAPVERLVPVSCAGCPASTSGLSTWWSSTALGRDLVLRRVSRLDAFSGYPVRT